jgi:hypothetical protein
VKTYLIATGGIRPGLVKPLELAVGGLLEIEDQDGVEALRGLWIFPTMPRPIELPQRRDARVEVKGCSMKASTATPRARVSTRVNVVGCQDDDEGLIMAMATALLSEHYLQKIVDDYSDEEPDEREELLSAMESLEDQVERLEAEVRRLRKKGS